MPTPFAELLLQILHVDPFLPDPKRLEALGVTEWEDFTTEAIRYRLAYQVSEYLKVHDDLRSRVPEACLARLSQAVRPTVMMNLQRQAQLRQMLVACEAEGIPFLLMKGLWIVEHMFPPWLPGLPVISISCLNPMICHVLPTWFRRWGST